MYDGWIVFFLLNTYSMVMFSWDTGEDGAMSVMKLTGRTWSFLVIKKLKSSKLTKIAYIIHLISFLVPVVKPKSA